MTLAGGAGGAECQSQSCSTQDSEVSPASRSEISAGQAEPEAEIEAAVSSQERLVGLV